MYLESILFAGPAKCSQLSEKFEGRFARGCIKNENGPLLLAARPRAARSRRRRRDFESEGVKMSIFSMVLRLCISHTHSIEAFIIWDVLRRLVVVPGIDVRLGCQVDVMAILAACDRTGSCSFQRDKSRNGAWFRR